MVNGAENFDRYWSVIYGRPANTSCDYRRSWFSWSEIPRQFLQACNNVVNTENIGNVTVSSFTKGDKNQNGTVILNLLNGTRELKKNLNKKLDVTPKGKTTGTVAIGGVSKDDLQGLMKGKSISIFILDG